MAEPLLEIRDLNVAFNTERSQVRPVRDVSLSVYPGQTLAVVGERLGQVGHRAVDPALIPDPPGKILGGSIHFEGATC